MTEGPAIATEANAQDWLRAHFGADTAALDRLTHLIELLIDENGRQNLVSRPSLESVWQRHIVDSAQLLVVSRETFPVPASGSWLDLGTGAGFPGLVVAALQPERPVVLVDSRRLRTEWLSRAAHALGLDNVSVVLAWVEDLPPQRHAVISARAFAPLARLLELSARFSTPQTLWLLPKGAKARHELQDLAKGWRHTFHVEQSLTDSSAGVLVGHLIDTPFGQTGTTTAALTGPSRITGPSARKGAHR
jgi:16S rRNA (guanine527-N7)-methyltransferase